MFFLFSYTNVEWNKLDANFKNAKSYMCFRNSLLKIGRPVQNSICNVFNVLEIKFLTRLRLGLSHLNEHKFKHNFQNCLNSLCFCSLEVESTIQFFLHCHFLANSDKSFKKLLKRSLKIFHNSTMIY